LICDYMDMENKIIEKLTEMDQKIDSMQEQMVTNNHMTAAEDRLITILDGQGQILQRLDQERLFTLERIKESKQMLHI